MICSPKTCIGMLQTNTGTSSFRCVVESIEHEHKPAEVVGLAGLQVAERSTGTAAHHDSRPVGRGGIVSGPGALPAPRATPLCHQRPPPLDLHGPAGPGIWLCPGARPPSPPGRHLHPGELLDMPCKLQHCKNMAGWM